MTQILYYSPGACSLASHIALETADAEYEAVRIDFAAKEQSSEKYLTLNPKGRVPALVTSQGLLTETPAILTFIAQSYPKAKLAPLDDPFAFAQVQSFNSYLCSTVHVAHAHKLRGNRWADSDVAIEEMRRKVPQTITACFQLIEDTLLEGPWVMGEYYSIADIYLFTLARWLEGDGVSAELFPKVLEHRNRMLADPAVQRVLASENN